MGTLFRHEFHPSILREYDIRGVVGETVFESDARALGVAFASVLRAKGHNDILTGHDGRLTSPGLEAALVEGLVMGGLTVKRLGCCPTPQLYYASNAMGASGAIMVTGSHNPVGYNGFKILLANQPFFGQALVALDRTLREGIPLPTPLPARRIQTLDVTEAYINALLTGLAIGLETNRTIRESTPCQAPVIPDSGRPLKVIWDNSHSSAGPILTRLVARLPGKHIVLNGDVDGRFPAHHPDPTLPENMVQLQQAVTHHRADLGLAFDGDVDRLGIVDEKGTLIPADRLSLLMARFILGQRPGAVILGDVKMSRTFFDGVAASGGQVRMCPSGHSEVKSAMREMGGAFAGEMSGHFFFADHWPGFDDGLYAAIRTIALLARQPQPLSALFEALPRLVATPEIRFDCADDIKFGVIEAVIARCRSRQVKMTLIDGVRVDEDRGWWLLRASNTQPALVARAEGTSHADCQSMLSILSSMLAEAGLTLPECHLSETGAHDGGDRS